MVHALSEAHRVLRAGGLLIDLRPATRNRRVELELSAARLFIGEIDSSITFPDHVAADEALRAAIADGKFRAEHKASFELITDFDAIADLRQFATGLRRRVMPDSMPGQIEALTADEAADYIIRTRREMLIASYRKLP